VGLGTFDGQILTLLKSSRTREATAMPSASALAQCVRHITVHGAQLVLFGRRIEPMVWCLVDQNGESQLFLELAAAYYAVS
jgi:hypothetical protein